MAPKKGGKKRGKDEKKPEKIKFKDYDLAKLLRQFKGERTRQENVRRKIAELVPQYVGLTESEHDEFLSGHGKALKKATRKEAADRSAKLQGQLEDFFVLSEPGEQKEKISTRTADSRGGGRGAEAEQATNVDRFSWGRPSR
jgi:hypothetical protein